MIGLLERVKRRTKTNHCCGTREGVGSPGQHRIPVGIGYRIMQVLSITLQVGNILLGDDLGRFSRVLVVVVVFVF